MQDRFGQAEVDIPAREMYADMLLADNRAAEALVQYRIAIKLSPNRFNSLYNGGRAAEAAGEPAEALAFYQQLLTMERTRYGPKSFTPATSSAILTFTLFAIQVHP
jgi:tetratricopeptide (TPR) repeat protein